MKTAMILAAGRGERLRPLTDEIPKPLIKVAGKSLIEYHLENLARAGYKKIIINTAWLAERIHQQLGDGSNYGVSIHYSDESEALETAGGIIKALPLLGDQPFLVVNGDIWCDFDFSTLPEPDAPELANNIQAHLILVDNPEHNPQGDFSLQDGLVKNTGANMFTFSGIGLYKADFFSDQKTTVAPLAPILRKKCENNSVSGQLHRGLWTDVGTIERLQKLDETLSGK
jgi:MurNAc alpha-1-phosphate uridylyltransferase